MKRISLISNSSIQYHKFDSEINLDYSKSNKIYFHQPFDTNILDFTLDPLFKVVNDDTEKYYRKQLGFRWACKANNETRVERNRLYFRNTMGLS